MSFLQPWMLAALPIAALPVIIHLINQRRYQTLDWGAMQFLLSANQMSRGFRRLRQWLIMAMRVLAIAGLLFAVSRPLASGWLGLTAGGQADTTIVLLDRSPSMQQRTAGVSKLDAARRQLVDTLQTLGSKRWVLIDSATLKPQEISSPAALLDAPQTTGVSASADVPAMLGVVHDYIKANNPGRTEVWIASDLRENDWQPEDGRWGSLRSAILEFPQEVRFHLLTYASDASAAQPNLAVRVTDARREPSGGGSDLVLSLEVTRDSAPPGRPGRPDAPAKIALPLRLEIDGAPSVMNIELTNVGFELKDHRVPLAAGATRGWGRVSLPADSNPADDQAFFVYDEPVVRRTLVVTDAPDRARAVRLAASISPSPAVSSAAETATPDALGAVAWETLALVVWQAPLPTGDAAQRLRELVDRGGQVIFLPPAAPTGASFAGVRWQAWQEPAEPLTPDNWRSDQDLLVKTESGASLPVGRWKVSRYCTLSGELNTLATLPGGAPLVGRAVTDHGGVYFIATTTEPRDSTLASDGVVLYAALRRVIDAGAQRLGDTRNEPAGQPFAASPEPWRRTAGDDSPAAAEALSTDYCFYQGVYEGGDKLAAVNRTLAEGRTDTVPAARVDRLFEGLAFDRVAGVVGDGAGLLREVWRLFLGAMIVALVTEAALCLPRIAAPVAEKPQTVPIGRRAERPVEAAV
ncbi:hypothetical protein Pla175_32240 [Pirellulimonas nuda]|uniref:Aerotolerance regulator N-terminal domain-containing protein n=1 Tax=Pirellulimonas nuda TaxID=2528009 RepID=A0A518DEC3_9BACT|nr:BatA domain-containing protein [Pirellulimonas nuda]QDU89828.1 hypothetical protein Pla175_32240 [Pirellulimonas nuda]